MILFVMLLGGCSSRLAGAPKQDARTHPHGRSIEFLYFDGCPNHVALREHLTGALSEHGEKPRFNAVDMMTLAGDDPRLRWGSPTILIDGVDLFDQAPSPEPSLTCRFYPSGVPSEDEIRNRLTRIK